MLAAFLLGAPVFVAMAGIAMALFFRDGGPEAIAAVPTATFNLVSSATLPAIPLLTAAGYVLAEGGAAQRLVRAYKGIFGWMPGGVAIMATFVCALFTTFTGASGVTILALGGLLLPRSCGARGTRRTSRSGSSPPPARSACSSRRRCR